jgi:hypothetical protein
MSHRVNESTHVHHGLIMGFSVTGRKVSPGESPFKPGPKVDAKEVSPTHGAASRGAGEHRSKVDAVLTNTGVKW